MRVKKRAAALFTCHDDGFERLTRVRYQAERPGCVKQGEAVCNDCFRANAPVAQQFQCLARLMRTGGIAGAQADFLEKEGVGSDGNVASGGGGANSSTVPPGPTSDSPSSIAPVLEGVTTTISAFRPSLAAKTCSNSEELSSPVAGLSA